MISGNFIVDKVMFFIEKSQLINAKEIIELENQNFVTFMKK